MTEKEWLIEMLCCLPKTTLINRAAGKKSGSEWLNRIDVKYVKDAIGVYDNEEYVKIREEQEKYC